MAPGPLQAKTFDEYVGHMLEKSGILLERIAPEYLQEELKMDTQEISLSQVNNIFTGVAGKPLLKDPGKVIAEAVREGVKQGIFGIRVGDQIFVEEEVPEEVLKGGNVALVSPPREERRPQPSFSEPGP